MNNWIQKTVVFWVACGWVLTAEAQTKDVTKEIYVQKSLFGIQAGILGGWAYHEWRVARQTVFRSELGWSSILRYDGISKYDSIEKSHLIWVPSVTVAQRWYYNLVERMKRSKDITDNSGNFFSVMVRYSPYWLVYSTGDLSQLNVICFAITFGIRRNIGRHFNYELGIRKRYQYHIFTNSHTEKKSDFSLILRIGYRFSKGTRRKKEK